MAESEQQAPALEGDRRNGQTVVIAVDGSEFSDYAINFYMESIHKPGNHVILAHSSEYKIQTYPAVSVMTGDPATLITKVIKSEEEKTNSLVESLTKKIEELKIDGITARIHGEPGPAICSLATQEKAAFVVVGCRGKGQMRKTFTGSVTDYIVHHSHVPVIVARHIDHLEKHHGLFHHKDHKADDKKHDDK